MAHSDPFPRAETGSDGVPLRESGRFRWSQRRKRDYNIELFVISVLKIWWKNERGGGTERWGSFCNKHVSPHEHDDSVETTEFVFSFYGIFLKMDLGRSSRWSSVSGRIRLPLGDRVQWWVKSGLVRTFATMYLCCRSGKSGMVRTFLNSNCVTRCLLVSLEADTEPFNVFLDVDGVCVAGIKGPALGKQDC